MRSGLRKSSGKQKDIRRLEATGILIIAVLLLLLTVVRYGRHIAWGAR
jgi:hypothetical protein